MSHVLEWLCVVHVLWFVWHDGLLVDMMINEDSEDDSNTTCDEDSKTTYDEDSNTTCDEDLITACDNESNTTCDKDLNTCEED